MIITTMKISAFFPCHNEALNIERVANAAAGVLADVADDYEIIVVDDGSVDDTRAAALRLAGQNPRIRVVSHERNMGYGAALRTGFAACRLEYVFFTDGDGQFDMQELRRLLPFVPQHDLVIGWRRQRRDPSIRRLYA
ncbi:MAG: glycosyltransferase family 2 protein, partial [Planctomycetes bacterium]|nr:glycosyltransferase family 2 protein [Planctomycetota bacterium]